MIGRIHRKVLAAQDRKILLYNKKLLRAQSGLQKADTQIQKVADRLERAPADLQLQKQLTAAIKAREKAGVHLTKILQSGEGLVGSGSGHIPLEHGVSGSRGTHHSQ